ncbi:PAC2 family protein, partial [Candidatus Woesearchaeota archaeon]|nr:PAC2 family protein [Candidatus Woesearchaeota archaeon]
FYNKKYNLVIVHAISSPVGSEWKLGRNIIELANQLNAKEIISLEGIGSTKPSEKTRAFYHTSSSAKEKKLSKIAEPLKEGIIMGLTGVLMLKAEKKIPISCIFAEAHSELPDSKAAAKVIEILNSYIGLKLDPKPLIKQAEKFEEKLKQLLTQTRDMSEEQKKKKLSYVG